MIGVFVLVFVPVFFVWYDDPTCSDGIQNQGETGIDCGGVCRNLCQRVQEPPIVLWKRVFELSPGVYHAAAYVENPNINAFALSVPYTFTFYNEKGQPIGDRSGNIRVPPSKRFVVFEPTIPSTEPINRVDFQFTQEPYWQLAATPDPVLSVVTKRVLSSETQPRIEAIIRNDSLKTVQNVDVAAILYDASGNAQIVSQTLIESLTQGESRTATFTWPKPLVRSRQCTRPSDVVLVIDRSGSMDDDGANPPQPLTAVKDAARVFAEQATPQDALAVVSFGSEASTPIDQPLSTEHLRVQEAISAIAIGGTATQQTNIGAGLASALAELTSSRARSDARRAIVMLTDGVATRPIQQGSAQFPEQYAINVATAIAQADIDVYAIGLGNTVNHQFLESLTATSTRYFRAASAQSLENIYQTISTAICEERPTVIEIIPVIHR